MSALTKGAAWQALLHHRDQLAPVALRDLFAADPDRSRRFSVEACDLLLDYSRNRITTETQALLLALARETGVAAWRERLFSGDAINHTEGRAVFHPALRYDGPGALRVAGEDVLPEVRAVRARMARFATSVRDGRLTGLGGALFTDVVNIGIGGSDLGPVMVCEALRPYAHPHLQVHFVSNVDGTHLAETLSGLDPRTTLFIITSKTFTTEETMANAQAARRWFLEKGGNETGIARHFVGVTTADPLAQQFGIVPEQIFGFRDWVGGRFSLWSAVGLSIMLAVGPDHFNALLAGAGAMDRHFREAPLAENLPVLLALMGVWAVNFWDARAHAVLPYEQYLHRFPAYLQQADMESNGKSVDRNGQPVDYATAPVLFGEPGTNGQHSFYQLLHQGTPLVSADFLVAARTHNPVGDQHTILQANALAQAEALMRGCTADEARAEMTRQGLSGAALETLLPYKVFPGNRPSNTLLYPLLTPRVLGALIALYEHKIFVQSVVWNINAFDQWGVELGKKLARALLPELKGAPPADPRSPTARSIAWLRARSTEPAA